MLYKAGEEIKKGDMVKLNTNGTVSLLNKDEVDTNKLELQMAYNTVYMIAMNRRRFIFGWEWDQLDILLKLIHEYIYQ